MTGLAPWKMFGDDWLWTRLAAKLLFISTLLLPFVTAQLFGWVDPRKMVVWEGKLWVVLVMASIAG